MNKKVFLLTGVFLIACFFSSNQLFAKGSNPEQIEVYMEICLDDGEIYPIEGDGIQVITPSSNFLRTFKFRFPASVMNKIDFGAFANKIVGVRITLETGETLTGVGFLNKSGNLNFNLHMNGAGKTFPRGWFP